MQKLLSESTAYATGTFGMWHVGGPKVEASDPNDLGVDYYAGNVVGNISDYYYWDLTIQGVTESVTEYHTSKITNLAIDWVATLSCQEAPWCG